MPNDSRVVFIVEDDAAMRKSIERLLRASGYSTTSFASAEECLQGIVAGPALGLVLDIHLPGMSGIEFRRRLLAGRPELPVVFVTAFDDAATRAEALAVGCVELLCKPFDPALLIEALERCRSV